MVTNTDSIKLFIRSIKSLVGVCHELKGSVFSGLSPFLAMNEFIFELFEQKGQLRRSMLIATIQ